MFYSEMVFLPKSFFSINTTQFNEFIFYYTTCSIKKNTSYPLHEVLYHVK